MPPRLREDLLAATVVEDAVTYVDVTDPVTGAGFRFYDFEYGLARQLDGQRPLEEIVAWGASSYGLELSIPALEQFVRQLADMGYLHGGGAAAEARAGGGAAASDTSTEGAQPAAMVPASTLGSEPFTTVAGSSGSVSGAAVVDVGTSEIIDE